MRKRVNLFPDECAENAYRIDYQKYYDIGYKGVIYDIDNTLVMHDAPADERAVHLFERLREIGFETCLVSNNEMPRVEDFNRQIGTHVICRAGKPKAEGYRRAMEAMGTKEENTLAVGDQLFTDIWGANRCGVRSILVRRIGPKEPGHIYLKRVLELPLRGIWNLFFRRSAMQLPQDA